LEFLIGSGRQTRNQLKTGGGVLFFCYKKYNTLISYLYFTIPFKEYQHSKFIFKAKEKNRDEINIFCLKLTEYSVFK